MSLFDPFSGSYYDNKTLIYQYESYFSFLTQLIVFYTYLTSVTCEPRNTGAVEEIDKIITCSLVFTWIARAFINVWNWRNSLHFKLYSILLQLWQLFWPLANWVNVWYLLVLLYILSVKYEDYHLCKQTFFVYPVIWIVINIKE